MNGIMSLLYFTYPANKGLKKLFAWHSTLLPEVRIKAILNNLRLQRLILPAAGAILDRMEPQ